MKIHKKDIDKVIKILLDAKSQLKNDKEYYEIENKVLSIKENVEFINGKRWCVLRTDFNHEIINNWFIQNNYGRPVSECHYIYIKPNTNTYYTSSTIDNVRKIFDRLGYTEEIVVLSFEEFKKHVGI